MKKMRIFLILVLLTPSLSWGDAHDVKFPFKLFCEKNEIAWTNKKETFYRLLVELFHLLFFIYYS